MNIPVKPHCRESKFMLFYEFHPILEALESVIPSSSLEKRALDDCCCGRISLVFPLRTIKSLVLSPWRSCCILAFNQHTIGRALFPEQTTFVWLSQLQSAENILITLDSTEQLYAEDPQD
ncbi:hypothetical protein PoB_001866300 [Plakobranchus ocellatus]|uniref:Uncharacterized protein n=1 Tax=Plakobranchus ocellatus TaxID=259542 RepID=A0AAV3ZC55_9GAST|nr:hypothetical protein PoB_001866300 [Plakobranchus ocellatus]